MKSISKGMSRVMAKRFMLKGLSLLLVLLLLIMNINSGQFFSYAEDIYPEEGEAEVSEEMDEEAPIANEEETKEEPEAVEVASEAEEPDDDLLTDPDEEEESRTVEEAGGVEISEDEINDTEGSEDTEETPVEEPEDGVDDEVQEEPSSPAFSESKIIDNVIISVAAPEGVFPEGAVLSANKVNARIEKEIAEAIEENREEGSNVASSYTYDIKVLDAEGNEIQPADNSKVQVSFKMAEAQSGNLDTQVYHIPDEEEINGDSIEVLEAAVEEGIVTVETEGFSYYTVEFTYEGKQYVLDGGTSIKLEDLLSEIGLSGEVSSWEVSNPELFDIYLGDENGISYEYEEIDENESMLVPSNDGTIPWLLSLKPFDTEEWLKVVIDGIEYEIVVTDDDTSNTVPASYSGDIETVLDNTIAVTADDYYTNAESPTIVKQSQSTNTVYDFAAGLPLSTIYIDENKLGKDKGIFAYETTDANLFKVIKYDDDPSSSNFNSVYYDPSLVGGHLLNGEVNTLSGPLFSFTFDDAAILPDGTKAKVKITYSNANIFTDERLYAMENAATNDLEREAAYYDGVTYLAGGSVILYSGTDGRKLTTTSSGFTQAQVDAATAAYTNRVNRYKNNVPGLSAMNTGVMITPSVGTSMDVTYEVIDDNGNPVNGTFIYAITGINLERDPYKLNAINGGKGLWWVQENYPDMHFFNEQIAVTNNTIASDYIYVRPNNDVLEENGTNDAHRYYYPQVVEENGKTKFISNALQSTSSGPAQSGSNGFYNSGFVTLANAFSGFTITAYGHNYGPSGAMETQAYGARKIWYQYTSVTGPNGNIQTTTEGNFGGTLDDSGDNSQSSILNPGTYVVTEGKTVTYTMTPDDNYRISKLYVKNRNGVLQEVKFNNKALHTMEEGDTVTVRDAANRVVTLTAQSNGVFTLTMPYAQAHEEVHVTWEPTIGEVTVKKLTTADDDTFNYRIKASKTEPVVTYTTEEKGSIWYLRTDVENDIYEYGTDLSLTDDKLDVLTTSLSDVTLTDSVAVSAGSYLWKTNKTFADLDLGDGTNDDKYVYVDFGASPNAVHGDILSNYIGNVSGTETEERIRFYAVEESSSDVTSYWNFNTQVEQSTDPGYYSFTVTTTNQEGETKLELPVGYTYEIIEDNEDDWELKSINGENKTVATGTISIDNFTPTEEFVNNPKYDLTVRKETENDAPGEFEFNVKVFKNDNNIDLSSYGGVDNGDGSYTFTTSNGGSFTIPNIPKGYQYKVEEISQDNWELLSVDGDTSKTQSEGTLDEDTTTTFRNRKYIELTFSKEVTGHKGDKEKEFEFEVRVYGTKVLFMDDDDRYIKIDPRFSRVVPADILNEEVRCIIFKNPDKNQVPLDNYLNSLNGRDMHIVGVTDNGVIIGELYDIDVSNFNSQAKCVTNGDAYWIEGSAYALGKTQTGVDDGYDTEYYPNLKSAKRGGLAVFDELDLSEYGGIEDDDSKKPVIWYDDSIYTQVYTFKLKHGDSITIPNIPYGYEYEIIEKDYSNEGYTTTVDETSGRTASGTLTADTSHEFVNDKDLYDLTISKTIAGNMGDKEDEFRFTVEFSGLPSSSTIIKKGTETLTADPTGEISETIELGHTDSITFIDIPAGTSYKVTEVKANQDGYTTTAAVTGDTVKVVSGDDEDVSLDGSGAVEDDALTDDTTIAFTNTRTGVVPTKASYGIAVPIIGLAVISILGLLMMKRRKARREA